MKAAEKDNKKVKADCQKAANAANRAAKTATREEKIAAEVEAAIAKKAATANNKAAQVEVAIANKACESCVCANSIDRLKLREFWPIKQSEKRTQMLKLRPR
jgi:hypothetical protein